MKKITLGRTGMEVTRTAFGALPIQRVEMETAREILRRAQADGINLFDTANGYTDSEEKIGYALAEVRERSTSQPRRRPRTGPACCATRN